MKRLVSSLLFAAFAAASVQAQSPAAATPPEPLPAPAEATEAQAAAPAKANARDEAAADDRTAALDSLRDRRCLRDTGTRIKRKDPKACNGLPGESYSGDELRRSGGVTTGEALRLLSPSIRG